MSAHDYSKTVAALLDRMRIARAKHGPAPYTSKHEMLGILLEEVDELREAIRKEDLWRVDAEVADIGVVVLHWLENRRGGPSI